MNLLFWGMALRVMGEIVVVLAVLHMHHSLIKEHKIDKKVILSYKQERVLTFIGLILITLGYIMEVYFYSPTPFFTCEGAQCAAAVNSFLSQ
jgi:hypothetical protein